MEKLIHVDIGGEGRYANAINVNRWNTTKTTTQPVGEPIPNLIQAAGEQMPFDDRSVDLITVENTRIGPQMAAEIARVIKRGGRIRLYNPAEYAIAGGAHQSVIDMVMPIGGITQSISDAANVTTTIVTI